MTDFQSRTPSLFLDRDGVINTRTPGDYVKNRAEFVFENGALEALAMLARIFPRIVVVTNQAGVGRGLMTEADLLDVHQFMLEKTAAAGGRIDRAYFCPHRSDAGCDCRKPAPGMAFQAKNDFPEIDFTKSVIVGDSASDMVFGQRLGMTTVLLPGKFEDADALTAMQIDFRFDSLLGFAKRISISGFGFAIAPNT